MPEYQFQRGNFVPFRSVTKIHLGAIQDDLYEDEVVYFDGQTLRRGTQDYQGVNLKAAIKAGWLVPEGEEGEYRPQSAGVQVRPPTSIGEKRGEAYSMSKAVDDMRDMGDPSGRIARSKPGYKPKMLEDNQVVGRIPPSKYAAAVGPIDQVRPKAIPIGGTEANGIVSHVSNPEGIGGGIRMIRASDIEDAIAGDELEDVLPGVASSGRPQRGRVGDGPSEEDAAKVREYAASLAEQRRQERLASVPAGKATVTGNRPSVFGHEAKVSAERTFQTPVATVTPSSTPIGGEEDGQIVGTVTSLRAEQPVEERVEKAASVAPSDAIIQAKIEMLQQFVPGFTWNMADSWQDRVRKAVGYKNNMAVLNAVLSIETDQVRRVVLKALYGG